MAYKPANPGAIKSNAKKKPKYHKPADFLRGSTTVGKTYTGYSNYSQGKPDFGKGAGPGTPYHEVQRLNTGRDWAPVGGSGSPGTRAGSYSRPGYGRVTGDPRTLAIRRRLGWI